MEGVEAAQQSLTPAERSALVQSLPPDSRAASIRCLDVLGGTDSEASLQSHFFPLTFVNDRRPLCERVRGQTDAAHSRVLYGTFTYAWCVKKQQWHISQHPLSRAVNR